MAHYGTLEAANDYHDARGNSAWFLSEFADDHRVAALVRASEWLDGVYRTRWPGQRAAGRAQALDWPRFNARDVEGQEIGGAETPDEVENATYAAALRELAKPGSLSPDVVAGTAKVLTSAGKLTWTPLRTFASAADMTPTLTEVERLLSSLIRRVGASVELLRV